MTKDKFKKKFWGMPCAVCDSRYYTVGHHLLSKGSAKALETRTENIIVLCNEHHNTSNIISAHGTKASARRAFADLVATQRGDDWKSDLRQLERDIIAGKEGQINGY